MSKTSLEHKVFLKESEECAKLDSSKASSNKAELQSIVRLLNEVDSKTTKLKPSYPEDKCENIAKALDDLSVAVGIAKHHCEDILEDI